MRDAWALDESRFREGLETAQRKMRELETKLQAERQRTSTQTEYVRVGETNYEAEALRTAMRRVTQLHGKPAADVCQLIDGTAKQLIDGQRAMASANAPQGPTGQPFPVPPKSAWKDD